MMLLVSGATTTVNAIDHLNLGRLYVPADGNRIQTDKPFAIDNGAFSGFDAARFDALLKRAAPHREHCLWVAAPDVVGDAAATATLFAEWRDQIAGHGLPIALVLQDGLTDPADVPWHQIDAVFIGGSTSYKLSPDAAALVRAARELGLHAHMGRVNTANRIRYAERIGCTSIDGSKYSKWPREWIGRTLNQLEHPQTALEVQ